MWNIKQEFFILVFFGVEQKIDNSEEIKVKISRGLSIIEKSRI